MGHKLFCLQCRFSPDWASCALLGKRRL